MTSRQARKQRREEERKAKKAVYKAALNTPAPPIPLEEEFSPEFIAEARAIRERVARLDEPAFLSAAKTQCRAEINRANAAHSTGPVTPAGKLASSRNSLKHGLASGRLIIPGEDQTAFEELRQTLLAEHEPASTTEEMLIHEMAQSWWLTQRALRLQNECFTEEGIDEKRLSLFLRYQTTHERAFHKALNTLLKLKQSRAREQAVAARGFVSQPGASINTERGFVSQNRASPPEFSPDPAADEPAFLSEAKTQANKSLKKKQPTSQAA